MYTIYAWIGVKQYTHNYQSLGDKLSKGYFSNFSDSGARKQIIYFTLPPTCCLKSFSFSIQ